MTVPTYTPEQEKALASHKWMSAKQAKWIFDLINTRVGITAPTFPNWRARYLTIDSRSLFETVLTELKALPVLTGVLPPAATEEGLYRDPETGKLYRLSIPKGRSWDAIISEYSEVSRARRLLTTGETVKKGTWRRGNAFQSRQLLRPRADRWYLKAEWLMSDSEKQDYITGMCNFCYRSLVDARSVTHNYGQECAKKHDLPWG
jgi:hypothetical protein